MNEDRLYGIDALVKIAEVLTGLSKDELGEFTLISIALARTKQEEGLK